MNCLCGNCLVFSYASTTVYGKNFEWNYECFPTNHLKYLYMALLIDNMSLQACYHMKGSMNNYYPL